VEAACGSGGGSAEAHVEEEEETPTGEKTSPAALALSPAVFPLCGAQHAHIVFARARKGGICGKIALLGMPPPPSSFAAFASLTEWPSFLSLKISPHSSPLPDEAGADFYDLLFARLIH